MKTGFTNLPLHGGKCPRWLFPRMKRLSGVISEIIINEYGVNDYLKRICNPYFFQALGCVAAYDWHSSGLTTTLCAALKESINKLNLGIKIAGGKGKTSKKTPEEIRNFAEEFNLSGNRTNKLIYSSKMCAKVDSNLIQDNYQLYHHTFILTEKCKWSVIQQGMWCTYARRYHWLSDNIVNFVQEPHDSICCNKKQKNVLNMTSKKSKEAQNISLDLVRDNPRHILKYMKKPVQRTINDYIKPIKSFTMMPRHTIIDMNKKNFETLKKAHEIQPSTYEELVALKGVGAKTIRSLALISDLIYGKPASWEDPVKYSFAHGGKDQIPYKINKDNYDETINILRNAIDSIDLGNKEKLKAIRRLNEFLKY